MTTERAQTALLSSPCLLRPRSRRTIRELGSVACGDAIALAHDGFEFRQTFQRCCRTVAVIHRNRHVFLADFSGFLVLHVHGRGYFEYLVVELASLLRCGSAFLRFE